MNVKQVLFHQNRKSQGADDDGNLRSFFVSKSARVSLKKCGESNDFDLYKNSEAKMTLACFDAWAH
jgi:hypothetical protein